MRRNENTMPLAIVCKFIPASNTRPRRISATISGFKTIIRSYPDAGDDADCYAQVALEALKLSGFGSRQEGMTLHAGDTPEGYTFVASFPWTRTFPVIK